MVEKEIAATPAYAEVPLLAAQGAQAWRISWRESLGLQRGGRELLDRK
jgi:hypothetical protein